MPHDPELTPRKQLLGLIFLTALIVFVASLRAWEGYQTAKAWIVAVESMERGLEVPAVNHEHVTIVKAFGKPYILDIQTDSLRGPFDGPR